MCSEKRRLYLVIKHIIPSPPFLAPAFAFAFPSPDVHTREQRSLGLFDGNDGTYNDEQADVSYTKVDSFEVTADIVWRSSNSPSSGPP